MKNFKKSVTKITINGNINKNEKEWWVMYDAMDNRSFQIYKNLFINF